MTIDYYCERRPQRGSSLISTNSNSSSNSMSSHLLVPGIHISRSESFRSENEQTSGTRVLPLRSGSFREPGEIQKDQKAKRNYGKGRSANRQDSSELTTDADFYLQAAAANRERRRSSLPTSSPNLANYLYNKDSEDSRDKESNLRRVRSFKTTTKGVVNRGDSLRKRGGRSARNGSDDRTAQQVPLEVHVHNQTEHRAGSSYYKVVILGAHGVGKTSITQQFMTSEYVAFDNSMDHEDNVLTVQLNGEESIIEFLDETENEVDLESIRADAYILVFSIAHKDTFDTAVDLLSELRMDMGTDRTVIMVGNKLDLVRKRKVKTDEAKEVSKMYDGKYIEVSAGLNHKIDELLVGILGAIRFKLNPSLPEPIFNVETKKEGFSGSIRRPISFFGRLFRRVSRKTRGRKKRHHTVS